MTDTEIDDEVDTTKIETETKTEQEEEEFDLEDSSNHLQEAHSEQPTGEGEVEAEVVTTDQTETVSNNTANGRTLWQQSTVQVSLHLLPVDDQPGGRPVMLGLRVAQGAPVIHQLREVDLGRLPFFVADQLARLEAGMTNQKPGQSDKASAVAPKPAPSAKGKPSSANARPGTSSAPKPQPLAQDQMDLFDW